ncbi:MAG TPA: hypothetical protein VIT67_12205 [Povalibacter sp.]
MIPIQRMAWHRARHLLGLASLLFVSTLATPVPAQTPQQQYLPWKQAGGTARDIGIGPQPLGDIWIIGTGLLAGSSSDYRIYRWMNNQWIEKPGGGVRIDVGPSGPAVVNSSGGVYTWNGAGWHHLLQNRARDVGIGGDGTLWYLGGEEHPGGYEIFRHGAGKISGSGVRIDVDNRGWAWIVTKGNAVYRYNGSAFVPVPGISAIDIGIDAESGTVYAVGTDGWPYKWTGSSWLLSASGVTNALNHISVDPAGMPWGVAGTGQIFSSRDQQKYTRVTPTPPPRTGVTIINDSDSYSWATIERTTAFVATDRIAAACLAPGQESSWDTSVMSNEGTFDKLTVRIERTRTENCKSLPGNAHVTCDTSRTVKLEEGNAASPYYKGNLLFTFDDSCAVFYEYLKKH